MTRAKIGVYGLGTMGSALALNLAEKGHVVAVANREADWVAPFLEEAGPLAKYLIPADSPEAMVAALTRPRVVLFMIPAGPPVGEMIEKITPFLQPGDMLVDAGNADFHDTRRRSKALSEIGLGYVGMGVSGGEEGARHGPSMMLGGTRDSWLRLGPMLESIAATFDGDPCVAHLGPDGAGHFVKTVHNGIEYADMQMIAEIYGLLRDGAGWPAGRIGALFEQWQRGPLASYLVEITADALQTTDPATGVPIVDLIEDKAGQKGTGRWTVIEALKLGQSASAIEGAVAARAWSSNRDLRAEASRVLTGPAKPGNIPDPDIFAQALLAGRILAHAQGFEVMRAASTHFDWDLPLSRIAQIWRAGCIIRSALLDDIAAAFLGAPPQGQLVLAPTIAARLTANVPALRQTVGAALQSGMPMPALAASLSWYDSLRQARGSTNLIQAQRDIFGAHGFGRLDHAGSFHGPWGQR